jgi:ubiquinone biosynthesis protein UbiJ
MATQSPFSFVEAFFQSGSLPMPPTWAVQESHRRILLLVNHILMQEPVAMERLVRHKGQTVLAQWREFKFGVTVTPAGLLDLAADVANPDLQLFITEDSPWALAQTLLDGKKPSVRVAGDVQLAAEINWLVDHVRWDIEEDLSRVLGDAPAHLVVDAARTVARALRQFVGAQRGSGPATGSGP